MLAPSCFTLIVLLCYARLCYGGKEVSPPSTFEYLLVPPSPSSVLFESSVPAGVVYSSIPEGVGIIVNVTYTCPNGTTSPGIVVNWPFSCPSGDGGGWSYIIADQQGNYTIRYNITHGVSSDPSQANATYCGPEQYSFQSWTLNSTFTVQSPELFGGGPDSSFTEPTITPVRLVSALPTTPTGSVPVKNSGWRLGSSFGSQSVQVGNLLFTSCLILCHFLIAVL
ncbi:hypothetical protein BT96DRAFT_923989 [Gymnopus androsaceus JB14]|uniref:Ig-like domain-containing protein n=1 Tax=Gymnopus androsaceus JB14 TaxID=1447944 RepID=A0A6A4H5M1_9AGAR|nr:hypothetical protein BT96DRAFT_923989 [Gymnopus androsaceus JB14]